MLRGIQRNLIVKKQGIGMESSCIDDSILENVDHMGEAVPFSLRIADIFTAFKGLPEHLCKCRSFVRFLSILLTVRDISCTLWVVHKQWTWSMNRLGLPMSYYA